MSIEIADEEIVARMAAAVSARCGATYHVVSNPPRWKASATVRRRWCSASGRRARDRRIVLEVYHEETEPLKDFYEPAAC